MKDTMILTVVFLMLVHCLQAQNLVNTTVYDAVIIGAGISGIGAGIKLKEKGLNFLILEARDRIGGRIASELVGDFKAEVGAQFIYDLTSYPTELQNLLKEVGYTEVNMKTYDLRVNYSYSIGAGDGSIRQTFNSWSKDWLKNKAVEDASLLDAQVDFVRNYRWQGSQETIQIEKNRLDYQLDKQGMFEGTSVKNMSTRHIPSNTIYQNKYIRPNISFTPFIQKLADKYIEKNRILLNSKVTQIDYSKSTIQISTATGGVYQTKKVFVSVPLGVLKAETIKFIPELNSQYKEAINSIGVGVFNKVIMNVGTSLTGQNSMAFYPQALLLPGFPFSSCYKMRSDVYECFTYGDSGIDQNKKKTDLIIATQSFNRLQYFVHPQTAAQMKLNSYKVTRWETDPYALGSYTYFTPQTKVSHFQTLRKSIPNTQVYFIGEHTHHWNASTAAEAYSSGFQRVSASLSGMYLILSTLLIILLAL